jgi:predicted RNase H-like HicB family nuclease
MAAYHRAMALQLTAVFRKVPGGYIGYVEELPGANTQGATLEEARDNLHEAASLILEANRQLAAEAVGAGEVIRESITVDA